MKKIVLLTKKTDDCRTIQKYTKNKILSTIIFEGDIGDPFPKIDWEVDYLISFLSPWIVPAECLNIAKTSINFHPAPPKYPGIGCYNFAIYNKEKEYGATCHHMLPKVDTGKLIKVTKFLMTDMDTVAMLKRKTIKYLKKMFCEVFEYILENKPLPELKDRWKRKPYIRKNLQELCRITTSMDEEEVKLRIKATYFLGAKDLPYVEIGGERFTRI